MTTAPGPTLPDLTLRTADGSAITLSALLDRPTLVNVLRHLACVPCQEHLKLLAARHQDFEALGVQVVGVSMTTPKGLQTYLKANPLPIRLFADPERSLYAALALPRTSWLKIIHPRIIWRFLGSIRRGGKVRPVPPGEDPLQLGGDFLLDTQRRILWGRPSADPTDRPTIDELLREVRRSLLDEGRQLP